MEFEVSQSKIKLWRRCKKAYEYKVHQKLVPRVVRRPLAFGTIVHGMLEAHFDGTDPWEVLKEYRRKQGKLFKSEEEEFGNILEDIEEVMRNYFWFYRDEDKYLKPWTNPDTGKRSEHNFKVRLIDTPKILVIYDFTIDVCLVDRNTRLWLTDHKSGVREVPASIRFTDLQSMMYSWGFKKATGIMPYGVLWNHIKSKAPRPPQLLKSGEFSRAMSQATTWYTYRRTLKQFGKSPKQYLDMKKTLEGRELDFFNRVYLPIKKPVMEQLVEEAKQTALEMSAWPKDSIFPRTMDKHCQWCDYQSICQAELQGLDAKSVRINEYRIEDGKARKKGTTRTLVYREED